MPLYRVFAHSHISRHNAEVGELLNDVRDGFRAFKDVLKPETRWGEDEILCLSWRTTHPCAAGIEGDLKWRRQS